MKPQERLRSEFSEAIAAEREACAKLVEDMLHEWAFPPMWPPPPEGQPTWPQVIVKAAKRIRERSKDGGK